MELQRGDILSDYDRWMKSYYRVLKNKDLADNTFLTYDPIFKKFREFITEQDEVQEFRYIDEEFFLSFLEWVEEDARVNKYAPATKTLIVSVLKAFFLYVSEKNQDGDGTWTYINEFKHLVFKKPSAKSKLKYLPDDDLSKLMDYLNGKKTKNHYHRIKSLGIKLMVYGGLRISEVLKLTLSDIKISDEVNDAGERDMYEIRLRDTKSGEEQEILIRKEYIDEDLTYFKSVIGEKEYIFKGVGSKEPINRTNFYTSVKKLLQKLGIDKSGLHLFRHTFAVQLYRNTGDVMALKETLRHSDIKTTMIYTHAEKGDIARALRK
jgi:integrase/recombinase XerD